MRPQRIALHIDELVLHGVPSAHRHRVGEAVREELSRLLAEQGLPSGVDAAALASRLDVGAISVTPGASPEATGASVARAVYSGLAGGGQGR
ncbi:hypothetical protein D7X55_17110 [Corallococcus sp. AB049A]|uniref:Uncharacterized protein n=1 Tax=Corallococcus interemptor TaxID=2316720 RepID=A0A3A8QXP5_9BACT|nr:MULTISPECIES: hypothetical protein [Corallococcus]RKH49020.1 hypothetical protein D7Y23_18345 [Corallococcus sp. AB050B]RKH69612.1 hypothetical protein D7X96_14225 [Corallococcus interemptor]RKI64948.1 hypothetical protein D7X55_17110 [Corallococcus sp. AB049A]